MSESQAKVTISLLPKYFFERIIFSGTSTLYSEIEVTISLLPKYFLVLIFQVAAISPYHLLTTPYNSACMCQITMWEHTVKVQVDPLLLPKFLS
jgi:hypothetical protein